MIKHSDLSKMKIKFFQPVCKETNYRDSLGEFSDTLHVCHILALLVLRGLKKS